MESSTQRKGLTWESPWEWWMGGALGWSGRGGCERTPLWSLETLSTSYWLRHAPKSWKAPSQEGPVLTLSTLTPLKRTRDTL